MKQISAAFVKAQMAFGPALKSSTNPHFKSKYADLAACVEAVIEALNANGIALTQNFAPSDSGVLVETVFIHESGERINCGQIHVPATKHDAQGFGSATTYARRYSLMAACGIAPEDDDGNAAAKAKLDGVAPKKTISALDGAPDEQPLNDEDQRYLRETALWVTDEVKQGKAAATKKWLAEQRLDDQQSTYLWAQLDSKTRSTMKAA